MPITTNAKSPSDKRAFKAIVTALNSTIGDDELNVVFEKGSVAFGIEGSEPTVLPDADFHRWSTAGYPWDGGPIMPAESAPIRPQPKPGAKRKPGAAKAAPVEKITERRKAPSVDPLLDNLVTEAFEIDQEERSGDQGRNVARFRRGELMIRLDGIAKASKRTAKELLGAVNQGLVSLASRHNVLDLDPITEQEATTTRRVVEAFGSSGEFKHVYGINPVTGDPLVNDAGDRFELPVTSVALNKLYPLVEYAKEGHADELLSFAHRHTEKVVKATKTVAKRTGAPFLKVARDVSALRVKKPNPLGADLGEVKAPPAEKEVLNALREMMGEAPEPDIATLKTSRAWYESTWLPIRALVDAIARRYMPDTLSAASNGVSNVFILERTLTQFYNPAEDEGVHRILGALVTAGDLSEANAHAFVDTHAFNPESGEWEATASGIARQVEADAAGLPDDVFGEGVPDIDSPDDDDFGDDDAFDD